ncbi:MAG: hypothetical protein ACI8ZM_000320 [Crocinitomix sp.]
MRFIFVFLLFISTFCHAQDTLTIYFDIDKSKIKDHFKSQLNDLLIDYDYLAVDSLQFIGFADTTGNVKSNMRLSERRAKAVEKYCVKLFSEPIQTGIYAKGEGTKIFAAENRKVEMVIHQKPQKKPTTRVIENVDPSCFTIEENVLSHCTYRTITKRKRDYIYIESEHTDKTNVDYDKLYYVTGQQDGKATVRRVKWKLKRTGRLWWAKKRYTATIPKHYFDLYKLFSLRPGPCVECSEEALGKDSVFTTFPVKYPDLFLSYNFQMKYGFFRKNQIKIRAPREYVDLNEIYFYQFDYTSGIVNWKTKRGRRKRNYYYVNLPISGTKTPYFKKYHMVSTCSALPTVQGGNGYNWMDCGIPPMPRHKELNIEAGIYHQNDSLTGFIGLGISNTTRKTYASIIGGINTHVRFFGSAKMQYFFYDFPFQAFSPKNRWETPAMRSPITKYGRLYVGVDLKVSYREDQIQFLEQNAHLGIAWVNSNVTLGMRRFYLHGGFANDFLKIQNEKVYPFVQIGTIFQFYGFGFR